MRQRAIRAIEESPGTTLREHQSPAVSDPAWAAMCAYWDDVAFKTKSEQMKKNRGKLRVVHTSGSQSFQEVKAVCIYLSFSLILNCNIT